MTPLHELLSRIRWDPEFGRGEFALGYLDKVRHEIVHVGLQDVQLETSDHFCLEITDEEGAVHSVPYHRVKEVWKDGKLIWQRKH